MNIRSRQTSSYLALLTFSVSQIFQKISICCRLFLFGVRYCAIFQLTPSRVINGQFRIFKCFKMPNWVLWNLLFLMKPSYTLQIVHSTPKTQILEFVNFKCVSYSLPISIHLSSPQIYRFHQKQSPT